jgi:uncharacterized protein with HEPN domain
MPPEDRDPALLWDMLETAREIRGFAGNVSLEDYRQNLVLRRAVERSIEIIGEAARGVSKTFKEAHPEIPWQPIMSQRHVLAHEYGEIDDERIWRVVSVHIPELIRLLEPLVPNPPGH